MFIYSRQELQSHIANEHTFYSDGENLRQCTNNSQQKGLQKLNKHIEKLINNIDNWEYKE